MPKYTFTFKKGEIELEYVTTDKDSMERQFQIWVTCASVWAYNQEKIEKGLMTAPLPKAEKPVIKEEVQPQETIVQAEEIVVTPEITPMPVEETVDAELILTPEQDEIERESQRIIQEYKAEMEAEARKKENDEKKQEFKNDVEQIVAKEEAVQEELSQLYDKPATIKDIKPSETEEVSDLAKDFDAFLQKSMTNPTTEVKEKRDDRFLKVIKVKNVVEKLDLLIVTAYYLSEFERLDRFTLKLVNAKLMENLNEVVDNGLVECLPNYTNIPSAMEYRLTEAGEEAFLNGRTQ